jgi:predicted AAA+ superfamily ATPase
LNIGGLVSYDSLANDLKLSFETVKKYLDAFEKSYMFIRITPYFSNRLKEIVKQPKIYFIDTGLRNIIANSFEITGSLFENYLFSEIIKAGFIPKYWRTKSKAEVDFIVEKDTEIIPIEAKLKADSVNPSLRAFIDAYNPRKAFIVTYEGDYVEKQIGKCKVVFTDVQKFINILHDDK